MLLRATAARPTVGPRRTGALAANRSIFSASTSAPKDGRFAVNDLSRPERAAAGSIGQALRARKTRAFSPAPGGSATTSTWKGRRTPRWSGRLSARAHPRSRRDALARDAGRSRRIQRRRLRGRPAWAPIPAQSLPSTRDDMKLTGPGGGKSSRALILLLPVDKVRHVAKRSRWWSQRRGASGDAAESLEVEYEQLPWVTHSEDALEGGAPSYGTTRRLTCLWTRFSAIARRPIGRLRKRIAVVKMKFPSGDARPSQSSRGLRWVTTTRAAVATRSTRAAAAPCASRKTSRPSSGSTL